MAYFWGYFINESRFRYLENILTEQPLFSYYYQKITIQSPVIHAPGNRYFPY